MGLLPIDIVRTIVQFARWLFATTKVGRQSVLGPQWVPIGLAVWLLSGLDVGGIGGPPHRLLHGAASDVAFALGLAVLLAVAAYGLRRAWLEVPHGMSPRYGYHPPQQ